MIEGTLAELECRVNSDGSAVFTVCYWRGDYEQVRRLFPTLRAATGFLAIVASNKARAWMREVQR